MQSRLKQDNDRATRRRMIEATGAALLLMRRSRVLPENLSLRDLRNLDDLASDVATRLTPTIVKVDQIGKRAGAASLGAAPVTSVLILPAATLAHKFSDAWRRRVMRAVIDGAGSPADAANAALRSRLETIAITESARGFNAKRQEIAERYTPASGRVLIKRWDAALDACEVCALMDGLVTLASDRFPGGEPGTVHPRCRCLAHYSEVSRLEFYSRLAA
jgi:hypothetical protein